MIASDARILVRLLLGQPRRGTHAERLQAFYAPQARDYDRFRERLLQGREDLLRLLDPPHGARVLELGGGTGSNLAHFGARLAELGGVELVDLCPALLEQARERTANLPNVRVIEGDATRYRPAEPPDCVYFSYALTMIPDWRAAILNAVEMLPPGGTLGVVDFYVSDAEGGPGNVRHGLLSRLFWPRWFGHDGVHPSPEHLRLLREVLPDHQLIERLAPVPYLPGMRVPYYIFVGRKDAEQD
ncbi:class I SAM-dependent methyltransferase [Imhoffiella purpurea]|uniref:Putative ubiquinone/menaquinone biosynthesis methyltransferase n=1 Tax=Imhoffiella purpurea TaxID=1249627 RepID=W9VEA3_9GAMM|nr:methyltransferase domain-containing protein [Imhoffiella purpurea]EXJ14352.1 Putative ubiquinone/menaquinone biosynthesis methyltransferase [Imhoffiella purpurea]